MNRAALEEGDCSLLGFGGNGRHFPAFRLSPKYESRQCETVRGSLHSRFASCCSKKNGSTPGASKHFQPFLCGLISMIVMTNAFAILPKTTVGIHADMIQQDYAQPLSQPDRPEPRRHNAKRSRFAKRQAIIYALANHESVESIRRNYGASRHTVLTIRHQYLQEIEAAQEDIKDRIALGYAKKSLDALDKIGQRIAAERSIWKQFNFYDMLTDRIQAIGAPVQKHPYPLSIRLAAFRRAKRNKLSVQPASENTSGDRSVWHEGET